MSRPELRPNPFTAWINAICDAEELVHVHRTQRQGLLAAAAAIRGGAIPENGPGFKILPGTGVPLAATMLANAIAWRQGQDVAVITPALQGGYAHQIVNRVGQGPCRQHGNGPFSIYWENSDREQTQNIFAALVLAEVANEEETLIALRGLPLTAPVKATISWVKNQVYALGRMEFLRADIESVIRRRVAFQRQHGHMAPRSFIALTVQQAKNREFDGVVVLWPYHVGGDTEHKRRLLYNAVTRARRWCSTIVQSQDILNAPPFAAHH